jgi:hypothetical protein
MTLSKFLNIQFGKLRWENFDILPAVVSVWLWFNTGGGGGGTTDVKSDNGSTFVGALRVTDVTGWWYWLWLPDLGSNLSWKKIKNLDKSFALN